jgi:hypothetical protein
MFDFDTLGAGVWLRDRSHVSLKIEDGGREETHAHKFWGSGSLNRITGGLTANSYSHTGGELQSHTTWKMDCVPAQRKF